MTDNVIKIDDSIKTAIFGESVIYFSLIDTLLSRVRAHRYSFSDNEWLNERVEKGEIGVAACNQLMALDILEKAHLSAVTALIRIQRWAEAMCLMYQTENYPGYAGALRGLLENGGESVDGLLNVAATLADLHRTLKGMLAGKIDNVIVDCSAIEQVLDHFIHAGWTGKKPQNDPVATARANADYVRRIESGVPGAVSLYHRLCAIVHPSNMSINWLFNFDPRGDGRMTLGSQDAERIRALHREFPNVANVTMQMTCNSALLTLRVLHKFPLHPKIPELKKLDWDKVKVGRDIEKMLRD